ncbi:winged helix-turn-helix transcriptional regulator [Pseudomonas sp. FYR_7]|uniref:winged helix-turn-helix transcriptional regulator n=1 Tax=Pseudomonas sp. FYR_7 TaxID=3367174 RepID=UPI00370CBBCB
MHAAPQLAPSECPVAHTLEAIGDRWAEDVRRFSDFLKRLGVAKNILTVKLKAMVELGVFEVRPASNGSAYKEYVLTEMGRAAFPIVISMRQWGERFLYGSGECHSIMLDNVTNEPIETIIVRSRAGRQLSPEDCHRRLITREG